MYKVINLESKPEETEVQFLRRRVEFLETALASAHRPDRGAELDLEGLKPMQPKILSREDRAAAFVRFEEANPTWHEDVKKVKNG